MSASPNGTGPIDGIWELVRAELDGEVAPELLALKTEMELSAGAYVVRFDGVVESRGTFTQDGGPEENTLILRGTEGPNAGQVIPCIYQYVGDRLRVCYGLDGVAPTGFVTPAGADQYLASYRRMTLQE
ncbi:MAG: hypothetical protein EXS35_19130 [Pedosphaera sp.]|nr:hypothetical protein [Pedosphaera sp.]